MKTKKFLSILLIIFCICLAGPAMSEDNIPGSLNQSQMNSRLTEEQKQQLKAKVEEMKEAGASQEEIKSAVRELFKSWGIKPENQGNQSPGRNVRGNLTEEQQQMVKAKIEEMKAAGASQEEIKSAVKDLLKSRGITPQNIGNQSQRRNWMDNLTDEQKKELKFTVEAMKNDGASWEEIRTVVKSMLKDWGITPSQSQDNQSQKRELMSQLTEEQRQELKSTVAEMKEAGVSQEEIKAVVKKMLKKWGITIKPPEQSDSKK